MAEEIVRELVNGEWVTRASSSSGGGVPDPSGEPDGDVLTVASGAAVWSPSGGSQPPTPFVQNADPGAVGAGALWVDTSGDPPFLYLRNTADDAWIEQGATPNLGAVLGIGNDANGNDISGVANLDFDGNGGTLNLDSGTLDMGGGNIATNGGDVTTTGGDVATGVGGSVLTESVVSRAGPLNLAGAADTLGFFGAAGSIQQSLARPAGDAGDLWDILNAHGLVVAP
jgi:hypothetical protein